MYVALGTESRLIFHRTGTREKSHSSTIITQHPTSETEPRYVLTPPQQFSLFRSELKQLFHHYFCENSTNVTSTYNTRLKTKKGKCFALWVQNANCIVDVETETTTTATQAGVSENIGARFMQRNTETCSNAALRNCAPSV